MARFEGQTSSIGEMVLGIISDVFKAVIQELQAKFNMAGPMPYVGIMSLILVLYWPGARYGFVDYDDPMFVENNMYVSRGLCAESIKYAFTNMSGFYQPVTWMSYIAESHFFGRIPSAFHMTNIWLHVLNAILVFSLLWRLTGNKLCAFAIGSLFAIHPVNVESVEWISERKGLLAASFFLVAITCFVRYLDSKRQAFLAGCLVSVVFSLLSKSTYVLAFPVILPALYFYHSFSKNRCDPAISAGGSWPIRSRNLPGIKTMVAVEVFLLVACGIMALVTIAAERNIGALKPVADYSTIDRLPVVLMFWFKSICNFVIADFNTPVCLWAFPSGSLILLAVITLPLLGIAAFRLARRNPVILLGVIWIVTMLLPVCGIVQIGDHYMAHRYLYLPLVGFFVVLGQVAMGLSAGHAKLKWCFVAAAFLYGGCLFAESRALLSAWKNPDTLWRFAAAHTENNFVAKNNLANNCLLAHDYDGAARLYGDSYHDNPDFFEALMNLGQTMALQGKYKASLRYLTEAEHLKPCDSTVYLFEGCVQDLAGNRTLAAKQFERALDFDPRNSQALQELANLLTKAPLLATNLEKALQLDWTIIRLSESANRGQNVEFEPLLHIARIQACLGRFDDSRKSAAEAWTIASHRLSGSGKVEAGGLLEKLGHPAIVDWTNELVFNFRQPITH